MLAINSIRPIIGTPFGVPVFVAGTGVTTALAYASYRWFETPILRFRDRLRRSDAQTDAPVTLTGSVPAVSARPRADD